MEAYKGLIRYYNKWDQDSAFYYAEQGLKTAQRKSGSLDEGIMLAQMGIIDQSQGRADIALQRFNYALQIYREHNYARGIGEMIMNIGATESERGKFDVATRHYVTALKILDSLNDKEGLMVAYKNLGIIYFQQEDSLNTLKYFGLAEKISKEIPLSDKTISLYNLYAIFYVNAVKDTNKALQIFLNNLELSDKKGFEAVHVECLIYLGNFYIDKGMPDRALQYLNKGLELARQKKMVEEESNLLLMMALTVKGTDPATAHNYLNRALEIANSIHNTVFAITVYNEKTILYKEQGKYKEAFETLERKQKVADSVFDIKKVKEIASISSAYEFDKSNMRIKQLEVLSAKNARERNIVISVSVVIAVMLVLVLYYYRKSVKLNKQLVLREQELKDSNKMKDKLFSIIGHDLRGPIAMIPAMLYLYEEEVLTEEEKQKLLEGLKSHVQISLETLDKLLYWGQSLIRGISIQPQKFRAKKYIKRNTELKKPDAAEKSISITEHIPDDLEVYGDPAHFDFIMRNLISNAVKYTHKGGKVSIAVDMKARPGNIVFLVTDDGIGIDKSKIDSVFQPSHSTLGTANEQGTGIGLMICKDFAKQNGGAIWVESEQGKGSTFYLAVKTAA